MKVCLITGTTSGIGTPTAFAVARAGYRVVMACRDSTQALALADQIRTQTDNEDIHFIRCDLASLDSVRAAAATFISDHGRLDLLINNAGILTSTPALSDDGFEMMFAVNHLGHFLLTRLLLPVFASPGRIVVVASAAHRTVTMNLDQVRSLDDFSTLRTYARSKLANVLFTFELARRLQNTAITVNCLHPGVVGSSIFGSDGWIAFGGRLIRPFLATPKQGAKVQIHLALDASVEALTGIYMGPRCTIKPAAKHACDRQIQKSLWAYSSTACGLAEAVSGHR